jgi:hypothetical protein
VDWPLLIVGVFAIVVIGLLFDAVRNPERWQASNVRRWRGSAAWVAAVTAAAVIGAGLAGAGSSTLGVIGVIGGAVVAVLLRIWLSAWVNHASR